MDPNQYVGHKYATHRKVMATTMEDVEAKTEVIEIEPKTSANGTATATCEMEKESSSYENGMKASRELMNKKTKGDNEKTNDALKTEANEEEIAVEIEPKTGVSFPIKLSDGKRLNSTGLRKKNMLGLGIKIYGFGIYSANEKVKDLLKTKIGKSPGKTTKELFQVIIDSDVGITVRIVIVYSSLTMNMVKKSFDEGLGASIKKLTGGIKNDELARKVMGEASDDIKLTSGSVIEISRLPGFILQTKVIGEVVSTVESELLCRAYIHMYIGDDPFDKDAKEKFGMSLLSLF